MAQHERSQLLRIVQYILRALQVFLLFIFYPITKAGEWFCRKIDEWEDSGNNLRYLGDLRIYDSEKETLIMGEAESSTAIPEKPVIPQAVFVAQVAPTLQRLPSVPEPVVPAKTKSKAKVPWVAEVPKILPKACVHCEVISEHKVLYVMELKEGKYPIMYDDYDDDTEGVQQLMLAWPNTIWLMEVINGIFSHYVLLCGTKHPFSKHKLNTKLFAIPMPNQGDNCHGSLCCGDLPGIGDRKDFGRIKDITDLDKVLDTLMLTTWNEDISPNYDSYGLDRGLNDWHDWSKRVKKPKTAYSKYSWYLKDFTEEGGWCEDDGSGSDYSDYDYEPTIAGYIKMLKKQNS